MKSSKLHVHLVFLRSVTKNLKMYVSLVKLSNGLRLILSRSNPDLVSKRRHCARVHYNSDDEGSNGKLAVSDLVPLL